MTFIYNIAFILFAIAYLPYLLLTGRYHRDIWQRFGFYPGSLMEGLEKSDTIWVHAVSVGEVKASRRLCESLMQRYPGRRLVISTITKTGNDTARKLFSGRATILYLPVDISFVLSRVFDRVKPGYFIIVETELWPNLITVLNRKRVPIVVVNGRVSPRSYRRYLKIRMLLKRLLAKITLFCMQNEEYKKRIIDMGAPPEKVKVTGNMKFDTAGEAPAAKKPNPEAVRNDLSLDADETLFVAGSTHRPEEEMILKAYSDLVNSYPGLRLLIAPRHIERVPEIERSIRKFSFTPLRVSGISGPGQRSTGSKPPVFVLDVMGRLGEFFSAATLVFMGGSLMPKGGQNILEAAFFSKPIIFGPHMFNFKDIAESFLNRGAARMVKDRDELFVAADSILKDPSAQRQLGLQAEKLIEENRGASKRNLDQIGSLVAAQPSLRAPRSGAKPSASPRGEQSHSRHCEERYCRDAGDEAI